MQVQLGCNTDSVEKAERFNVDDEISEILKIFNNKTLITDIDHCFGIKDTETPFRKRVFKYYTNIKSMAYSNTG